MKAAHIIHAFGGLFVLVSAILVLGKVGGPATVTIGSDVIYVLAALLAGAVGVRGFAFVPKTPQGLIVGWLALGMLLNALAGGLRLWYEASALTRPFPSLADGIMLIAYLPPLIGLGYGLYRARGRSDGPRRSAFLVAWLVLTVATFASLIIPLAQDQSAAVAPKVLNALHPLLDLLLILLAGLLAATLWGGAFGASWALIFIGLFALALGDLSFSYLTWKGVYATGSVTDVFWIAGFALLAAGFEEQRSAVERRRR